MFVSSMPQTKAIVAGHQGEGYRIIFKQLEVHYSIERKIIQKWKTFKTVGNLPRSEHSNKFTPRSDFIMLRETAKTQEL